MSSSARQEITLFANTPETSQPGGSAGRRALFLSHTHQAELHRHVLAFVRRAGAVGSSGRRKRNAEMRRIWQLGLVSGDDQHSNLVYAGEIGDNTGHHSVSVSASAMASDASRKRRRVALACSTCRNRKTRVGGSPA